MHSTINIIADVAGRFDELMELLGKMPAASLTLGVGDLVDRGPKSRQVIDVYGHNSWRFGPSHYIHADGRMEHYASCIDNSRQRELTGLHWPTKELFAVEYHP